MTMRTPTFHRALIAVLLGLVLAGGAVRLLLTSDWYQQRRGRAPGLTRANRTLRVDVDGAVRRPGVYTLPAGAIRDDAVKKAGGRAPGADTSRINLAVELKDKEKIYIPFKGENTSLENGDTGEPAADETGEPAFESDAANIPATGGLRVPDRFQPGALDAADSQPLKTAAGSKSATPRTAPKSAPSRIVNINTADAAALMSLPGIGETYARRIIEVRKQRGPFKSIEEIMFVKGIGEKTFEKLKPYIRVQ